MKDEWLGARIVLAVLITALLACPFLLRMYLEESGTGKKIISGAESRIKEITSWNPFEGTPVRKTTEETLLYSEPSQDASTITQIARYERVVVVEEEFFNQYAKCSCCSDGTFYTGYIKKSILKNDEKYSFPEDRDITDVLTGKITEMKEGTTCGYLPQGFVVGKDKDGQTVAIQMDKSLLKKRTWPF